MLESSEVVVIGRTSGRFRLSALLSGLSASLFVITLVWRDWIERVFGIEVDQHSGSLEWLIVAALFAAAIGFGALAAAELRRRSATS
jgi:hypothetical protein